MSEYIDNQTQREGRLKSILRQLHEGKSVDEVKAAFADLLEDVGPDEIVRIEEALVNEGLDPAQIQPLCDVHVALFKTSLDKQQAPETTPGHPIFTYRAENFGVQRVLKDLEQAVDEHKKLATAATQRAALVTVDKLMEYDRHYLRKENLLFPFLERTGFAAPAKVMWGVHDEIRADWKALRAILDTGDKATSVPQLDELVTLLASTIRDMIYKEDHILFPAALKRLSDADWKAIRDQGEEIGYAYALPGRAWVPAAAARMPQPSSGSNASSEPAAQAPVIPLQVGALTTEQIDMMLQSLPVDITFVDENDEVRYFSQGRERVFQRSPAIIGRKVQNCHPPQSVHKVQRIVEDFKAGRRDVAEFWIQMQGMFVHIRYFALRDESGAYKGTIEVTQNLAPLRALEGERRLLDD